MKYKILRMDKAEGKLREIIFYIADDSGNVDIALSLMFVNSMSILSRD